MTIDTNTLLQLVQAKEKELLDLVRQASLAIMEVKNQSEDLGIQSKEDNSPVTKADLAAHNILVGGLARLFPDILIVSEEDSSSHQDRLEAKYYWLVDPLDGTKEFINGFDDYTVNLGLICRDEQGLAQTRFGVMGIPEKALYYTGGCQLGAQKHQVEADGTWQSSPLDRPPIHIG